MAKTLNFGNVVLCEFVAKGSGNKHTLVNTFSGDVIVEELPATIMLALYIEYIPHERSSHLITFNVNMNDNLIADLSAQVELAIGSKMAIILMSGMGVGVTENVTLTVTAATEGFRKKTILSKKIYKGRILDRPEN